MKGERTGNDPRFKEIKKILQDERPDDFEAVFGQIIQKLSQLVNENNSQPLSDYLDGNLTIGEVLTSERTELSLDTRRNPKTIMSFMREIFEEYKKRKESNNN